MKTLEELIEQFSFDGDGLTLTSNQIAQLLPGLKQAQSERQEKKFNDLLVVPFRDYDAKTKELEAARTEHKQFHDLAYSLQDKLDTAMDELEAARADLKQERAIVDRIWDQLGRPSYQELKGRSIYDLIDEKLCEIERLTQALNKARREGLDEVTNYFSEMMMMNAKFMPGEIISILRAFYEPSPAESNEVKNDRRELCPICGRKTCRGHRP